MNKLIATRGIPGSGKSTRAQELVAQYRNDGFCVQLFSTDDFWGNPYKFVSAKLKEAHLWNQHRTMLAMIEAHANNHQDHLIVVDNTHISAWELRPYVKPAYLLGFDIEFVEPSTAWAFDAEECARRNVHNVPLDTIRGMIARYDNNVSVEKCLQSKAPWEK
jgi:predicted kinase